MARAALLPVILLACTGAHSARRGDRVDVSGYPQEIQQAYRVFAVRCSRCHTLARPLNAHITDPEHWVRYVTRMRRQPTSGINREDAEIILRFLLYYTEQERKAAGMPDRAPAAPESQAPAEREPDNSAPPPPLPAATPSTDESSAMPATLPEGSSP